MTCKDCKYCKECIMSYPDGNWKTCENFEPKTVDGVLDDIKAEIDNESIGYPPSADYYKAIKKAVRIIEKHISGKENE